MSAATDLASGLRQFADFLDAHPHLPGMQFPAMSLPVDPTDVCEWSAALATPVADNGKGHRVVESEFGPLRLAVHHVSGEAMARYDALHSYSGAVTP